MTPYASALVMWAQQHPDDVGRVALDLAGRLDPQLPGTAFLRARWQWREGSRLRSALSYLRGWSRIARAPETRRQLVGSWGGWLVLTVAWVLALCGGLLTVSHVRKLVHDARELGRVVFKRANAVVFAVVVLLIPLFAGLGPLWLASYLFVLTWAYMRLSHRVAAVAICVLLALVVPTLEVWQSAALRAPRLVHRVSVALERRQLDFSTLREFADLEAELENISSYHLVLGELLRLHGEPDGAQRQFQKASLADGGTSTALVFLGNLSLEEGDYARALEHFSAAVQENPNSAIAYYNLSTAYDLNRRFQDGDEARRQARALAGRRPRELGISGTDERVRYPRLGAEDVAGMVAAIPETTRIKAGLGPIGLRWERLATNPFTVLFVTVAVFGVVLLPLRSRWMWVASTCSRCGRVFCPRCKTATESSIYCSQCISVFLKRDVVSIEQQSAKLEQVRRWEAASATARRLSAVLVPGAGSILAGKLWRGVAIALAAWLMLTGALAWAPRFLPSIEPLAAVLPVQVMLLAFFAVVWVRSVAAAWSRR